MKFEDFEGKVALITGSTGGVGYRAAEQLLRNGAHVVINGRSDATCDAAVEQLRTISPNVSSAVGNSSDYDDAVRVASTAAAIKGQIDVLISSGARSQIRPQPFAEMDGPQLVEAFNTRFFARMLPVRASLDFMKENGGSIVLMGTDAARHTTPGESVVGAFGAAVISMTKTLAKEFQRWNIRVNTIAMTITSDTPSWDRIFGEQTFQTELFAKAVSRFPLGRAPTADEVAQVALFLASQENIQVNGQTISVNGGLSFGGW